MPQMTTNYISHFVTMMEKIPTIQKLSKTLLKLHRLKRCAQIKAIWYKTEEFYFPFVNVRSRESGKEIRLWARSPRNRGSIPRRRKTFLPPPKRSDRRWGQLSGPKGFFHRQWSAWGMKLTIYVHLASKLRRGAAIFPLPYSPSWRADGQLYCIPSYHWCYSSKGTGTKRSSTKTHFTRTSTWVRVLLRRTASYKSACHSEGNVTS
jgi:hypothetical protein